MVKRMSITKLSGYTRTFWNLNKIKFLYIAVEKSADNNN